MTYKGIFVDDQELVYAETLSTPEHLEFKPQDVEEVAVLARKIVGESPIIVAIDYRLDEAPAGLQADQTYKGSALAQHLRDASIEHPDQDFALALVSAESKIKTLYRPDKTAHDLFDRVYVKEDINNQRAAIRLELLSLCHGYEKLRAVGNKYDIIDLMAGNDDDRPHVDAQEIRTKLAEAAAPHVVARMLFNLIDRPGPLLTTEYACAHLGIDPGDRQTIIGVMRDAGIAYEGVFGDAWPRWWAHRLENWAQGIFKRRATGLPAADRARILSESVGKEFEPARSPWNQSSNELISFACASCARGTELRHSVAAFEPSQPRYIVRRRICWDCVQKDQYEAVEPPLSIDDADKDLAEQVKGRDRNEGHTDGAEA
ncbi:hypothetical protein [Erythrobacter sp.]|uniref:hypothetical protein n=1 Tax=Erythrobacter sp. TaxID=1042 RepID=UPI00311FC298